MAEEPTNKQQTADVENNQNGQPQESEKTFTQAEVDAIVKKRIDRVTKKFEEQQAEEEQKRLEAEKLKQMDAEEKQAYKLKKLEKKLNEATAKLNAAEMRNTARKMLADKGVSATEEQLDLVVSGNAEQTSRNIEQLASIVSATRENVRKELLAGSTPRTTHGNDGMTREEIAQIKDPLARRKAMEQNVDLYR